MTPPSPPKVLLADDDEVTREVLGMMLEDAGYEYESVASGDEAVSRALSGEFAAVLMDYEMPTLNGLEATLRIRRLEQGKKTPIILLSAHTEKRNSVFGAGANAYLVKPVTAGTLRTTLASWTTGGLEPEVDPSDDNEPDAEMLALFLELVPQRLKCMRESLASDDLVAARSEAHRLIGSCAVLGFARMAASARQVASGAINPATGIAALECELARIAAESELNVPCSR